MFYEGVAQDGVRSIGVATSRDGQNGWTRHPEPVLSAAEMPEAWDAHSVGSPCAVSMAGALSQADVPLALRSHTAGGAETDGCSVCRRPVAALLRRAQQARLVDWCRPGHHRYQPAAGARGREHCLQATAGLAHRHGRVVLEGLLVHDQLAPGVADPADAVCAGKRSTRAVWLGHSGMARSEPVNNVPSKKKRRQAQPDPTDQPPEASAAAHSKNKRRRKSAADLADLPFDEQQRRQRQRHLRVCTSLPELGCTHLQLDSQVEPACSAGAGAQAASRREGVQAASQEEGSRGSS